MEKLLLQKFWVEWSKSENEKQISYVNTYTWMLEVCTGESICSAAEKTQT